MNPHLVEGTGKQVAIITLWTKKEHVLAKIPENLYKVTSQLYSRDEGISMLIRGLLKDKNIRDLVMVGVDLNKCSDTLKALWENGSKNGEVVGAPGYVDTEIPENAINEVRKNVDLHDLRTEKDYEKVAEYIKKIEEKNSWGEPEEYPSAKIVSPTLFPSAKQFSIRHNNIKSGTIELAYLLNRFGELENVQAHFTNKGTLPQQLDEATEEYTKYLFENTPGTYGEELHKYDLTKDITITLDAELKLIQRIEDHIICYLDNTTLSEVALLTNAMFTKAKEVTVIAGKIKPTRFSQELTKEANILKRSGDPRSNILVRLKEGRIHITQLSPEGKRIDEFTAENAMEAYKRLIVEHRITDLSHAAYLGYELAKAENALKTGGMYEQDSV